MKRLALALALLWAPNALAQNAVTQNGSITVGHLPVFQRDRMVGDIGGLTGASSGPRVGYGASPFAITDSNGMALCLNTAATTGSYHKWCIGHDSNGNPQYNIDDVLYPFTGNATGTVVGPVSSTDNGFAVWNGTNGTALKDSTGLFWVTPSTIGSTGNNNITLAPGGTGVTASQAPLYGHSTQACYSGLSGSGSYALLGAIGTSCDVRIATTGIGSIINYVGTKIASITTTSASGVNYPQFSGADTGSGPIISAQGTDTNIPLQITTKGTGQLQLSINGTTGLAINSSQMVAYGPSAAFTSAFPAIKRSSTTTQFRLADDSADAPISAAAGTFSGTVTAGASSSFIFSGRAQIQSTAAANLSLLNNGGTDFGLLQFGGTTSSFPALKRSTTKLFVRLADDSADAEVASSKITTSDTAFLHNTSAALANGAAAQVGTLTNAPAAGDPTKWIAINDNGTTRYIPAW